MSVTALKCPSCGTPIPKELLKSNKPFECSTCQSTLVLTDWTRDGHIICIECGAINDSVSHRCNECGQNLRAGCPYCYESNWIGATWCENCGANVRQAWERQKRFLAEQEKQEEERQSALKQAKTQEQTERLQRLLRQLDEPEGHPLAIYGLVELGTGAVEPLIALLASEDPDARYGAAHALGRIGDQRAVANLTAALGDSEAAVRYWAADALGKLGAETAAEPIGKLLNDKHQGVRRRAAAALKQIGTPKATRILRRHKRPWWPFR